MDRHTAEGISSGAHPMKRRSVFSTGDWIFQMYQFCTREESRIHAQNIVYMSTCVFSMCLCLYTYIYPCVCANKYFCMHCILRRLPAELHTVNPPAVRLLSTDSKLFMVLQAKLLGTACVCLASYGTWEFLLCTARLLLRRRR